MNIDVHQHFWIYEPQEYAWINDSMAALRRDFLPADLERELAQNDFQGCIAVQTCQTLEETRWLLEFADKTSFIYGVVGWVDLRSPQLRSDLDRLMVSSKLVGIRHIVQSEPDDRFLLQPDFLRGISTLEEFDLAYDILIYPRHLPVAAEFVSHFERQRFVLDHLAKPPIRTGNFDSWKSGIRRLAEFPNVTCKLSGLVTEADWTNWKPEDLIPYLDAAFEYFGPTRLMIGSDWPVCTLAASYSRTVGVVKDYLCRYSSQVRNAVLGENAERVWRLSRQTHSRM